MSSKYAYNKVINKLENFFKKKNFIQVNTQSKLSILSACEDPKNIVSINFRNEKWPLPQTGQMHLEFELLNNPKVEGFYCQTTSYREEKNPIEGRHDFIFPLFEFEFKGDMNQLLELEMDLLKELGYKNIMNFDYDDICDQYKCDDIDHIIENKVYVDNNFEDYLIKKFPLKTEPFWNMKLENGYAKKIDVILSGQETIGSAERACNIDDMIYQFYNIENGEYAKRLFYLFSKKRVLKELNDYIKLKFIMRSGGGIGVTRLLRSMNMRKLI